MKVTAEILVDNENYTLLDAKQLLGYKDAYVFIDDFRNYLRNLYKYDEERTSTLKGCDLVQEIYDSWYEMLKEQGVITE